MARFPAAAAALTVLAVLAGCTQPPAPAPSSPAPAALDGRGDVVVVAVIDTGFDPYHLDFRADTMPQALDDDPSNDLPLEEDPSQWLPGYPDPSTLASFRRMDLTLPDDDSAVPAQLHRQDKEAWDGVRKSDPSGAVHLNWIPGTKAVGFVDFDGDEGFSPDSHGVGTTSVSVGNLHGACPDCVFVFVNGFSDEAVSWVSRQPWIDVQTNSWGYSKLATDKMWTDCDVGAQRAGVERGQQLFFSAGNGLANAFDAPTPTLYSCQKGPDWIVTVGANTREGASYTGHGKPADISNVGSSYPSAGGATVTAGDTFGGTSNATPVTAGLYAEALHRLRRELAGPSRLQANGTIARGPAGCGAANPACALADGGLTGDELRRALFDAAALLDEGMAAFVEMATLPAPAPAEVRYLNQGHGSFFGRIGDASAEAQAIADLAAGDAVAAEDAEQVAWMAAVSYCSQMVWGSWEHGAWKDGDALPPPDPQWPLRTWLVTSCPDAVKAAVLAGDAIPA